MKTQTDDGHTELLAHWDSDIQIHSSSLDDSSQPRSSVDSAGPQSSLGHWRDSPTVYTDRRDTISIVPSLQGDPPVLVEPNFDEGVLRALCELDVCCLFLPTNLKLGYPVTHCFIINGSAEFHFYWIELNKAQSLAEYAHTRLTQPP